MAVAAASVAAGLTACSGATGADGGPVSITFLTADPQKNLQPAIDGFEKANPNITIEYEYVPFDQYNNLIEQRIGSGDAGVDVYAVDSGAVGALANKGYLEDLTDDFGDQVASEALPATAEANTFDDRLWSVPMWTSAQFLYYNKDLLDEAGVPYPSSDVSDATTYQELLENGKKAQASGAKWGLLFDQINRYYQLQPVIESAGGGSGVTGDDLLTADLANEGWVEAMTWYAQLFEDGVAPRGVATEQMPALFASGQAAYIVSGPWQATANAAEGKVNYGVAANPVFEGGEPAMSTGSWNVGINPATDEMEASKALVEYLGLTKDGNTASAEAGGIAPTFTASFDGFVKGLDERDAPNTTGMGALTSEQLNTIAVNRPNSPGFTQMTDVTGRAFEDIRNGQDVEDTLSGAQDELQGLWDRLR
ncbi:extracellular solute-binding protein [Promicromonospora vindobonensis]|uniref:Extracellular solute-binding protein n=1 Tax=Promicromonospora vindobonensis TaxID=195748 RepID=A0ABW5VW06_9MICO